MSSASSLDALMNDPGQLEYGPYGGVKTISIRRARQENARRKEARHRLERGLRRRLDFTPEEIEEKKTGLPPRLPSSLLIAITIKQPEQNAGLPTCQQLRR